MSAPSKKHIVLMRNHTGRPVWGGLEKLVFEWFERIDYFQCDVTLCVAKEWMELYNNRFANTNIRVRVVELDFDHKKGLFLTRLWNMHSYLKKLKPSSVIFLQGRLFCFDLSHILAARLLTGEVFMHENLGPPVQFEKTKQKYFGLIPKLELWWYIERFSTKWRARWSKKIVTVSREIKDKLISLWDYPSEKMTVCYHGVDADRFAPSQEDRLHMRRELALSPVETVIIAVSRLSKEKCVHHAIEAFSELCKNHKQLTFLIAGAGPLEMDLKALARKQTCEQKIRFLGQINDVADYLKTSDVYVLSSNNEGFGIALVEALATGLICVSTKCAGPNEILKEGVNGFLVDQGAQAVTEGLRKAISLSESERKKISQNAIADVRAHYEINQNVRATLKELEIPYLSKK